MRVVMLKTLETPQVVAKGRECEVPEARGRYLVAEGLARPVEIDLLRVEPIPEPGPTARRRRK